jgi:hypothetical protein
LTTWNGVDRDRCLRCVGAGALGVAGSHVQADRPDLLRAILAEFGEEAVGGRAVRARGTPHDLAATMIGHERQVAMLRCPADLVDTDLKEVLETVGIKLVTADALNDPPDGAPVDAHQPGDRALVSACRQPRDQGFEVARETAARSCERDRFGPRAVARTPQPPQLGVHLKAPHAEIQVPPHGVHRARVKASLGAVGAVGALQMAPAQRDRHDHPRSFEAHCAHPHPVQAQQARECRRGAHAVPPSQSRLTAESQQPATPGRRRVTCIAALAGPSRGAAARPANAVP